MCSYVFYLQTFYLEYICKHCLPRLAFANCEHCIIVTFYIVKLETILVKPLVSVLQQSTGKKKVAG